ncbi:MAG TPA: hypothetical protein VIS49_00805 [Cyclobacteriaceae bacterium]
MNLKIVKIAVLCISIGCVTTADAQEEKISPRIDLSFHQTEQAAPYILVNVRKRIDRRYYPMSGIPVEISLQSNDEQHQIGTVISNADGKAKAVFPDNLKALWESLTEAEFYGSVAASDSTDEADETLMVSHGRLTIVAEDEHVLKAKVERKTEEDWEVVPEVELKFFIKRYFGKLPIGEDFYTTDESGEAELEWEGTIPGNEKGDIELGCWFEDNEEFGTISALTVQKWGVPLVDDNKEFESRTLWATRDKTPYWLLIFPNLIILGVWGIIGYLVFQIIKIKKLQNQP